MCSGIIATQQGKSIKLVYVALQPSTPKQQPNNDASEGAEGDARCRTQIFLQKRITPQARRIALINTTTINWISSIAAEAKELLDRMINRTKGNEGGRPWSQKRIESKQDPDRDHMTIFWSNVAKRIYQILPRYNQLSTKHNTASAHNPGSEEAIQDGTTPSGLQPCSVECSARPRRPDALPLEVRPYALPFGLPSARTDVGPLKPVASSVSGTNIENTHQHQQQHQQHPYQQQEHEPAEPAVAPTQPSNATAATTVRQCKYWGDTGNQSDTRYNKRASKENNRCNENRLV